MRNYFAIAIIAFACIAPATAQEPEFPYNAIVLGDDTKVHSGPGDSHYATHSLEENDLVEVYRHDPGGWCAIRPPEKSFSLIPESAVKRLSKEVAEVLADGSQAWVGTALGPVDKPLWQVKLKKGERVAIVGEATWPHPSGKSVVWLQIEPPAGEYRWIRMADLQLPPVKDDRTKVDYSEPPKFTKKKPLAATAKPRKTQRSQSSSLTRKKTKRSFASESASSGWKSATRPIPKTEENEMQLSGTFGSPIQSDIPDNGFVDQATFLSEQEPADPRFENWDGSPIPDRVDPAPSDRFGADRFASRESMDSQVRSYVRERTEPSFEQNLKLVRKNSSLIQIEERLSQEILKDPRDWNLEELEFATEQAKARSVDPVERLAFQHVLDKITRCDGLRKSYQQASPFASSRGVPSATSVNSPYDATGWLKRLASSTGSIDPRYVLQDSLGNVTHEIVGIAGMNLGSYVDKKVGVLGRRGFNQRLSLKHVTVDRVVVIR